MNKKGAIIDIIVWIVVAFVVVVFFGLWVWGFDMVTDKLVSIDTGSSSVNVSEVASQTFGVLNTAQASGLKFIAFCIIVAMALSILVSNFIIKSHPVFFIVYIFVIVGAFIGAVYISNAYETLTQDASFGPTLLSFKAGTFIMLNLPIWTLVIGIFGAIILFIGITIDAESGGGI